MNSLNIFTTAFNNHSCLNSPPKTFKWVFNTYPNESKPVVYFDDAIFRYINDGYSGQKYGWLGESSEIISHLISVVISNKDILKLKYKKIFTNDKKLVDIDPSFFVYNPPASNVPWITQPSLYEKTKLCSYITSFKHHTSGHVKRLELFQQLKDDIKFKNHIFGRDYNYIPDKLYGLKDYMFSIVIENSIYPKYYTEKITDAFATGTVPVYYGDRSISEDFDEKGIIFLDDLKDWNHLSPELYISMKDHVKNNFEKTMNMISADDYLYNSIKND